MTENEQPDAPETKSEAPPKIRRWGTVEPVEPAPGPVKIRQFGSGVYATKVIRPEPPPAAELEPPPTTTKPTRKPAA